MCQLMNVTNEGRDVDIVSVHRDEVNLDNIYNNVCENKKRKGTHNS